jgi:hypothetical protein
MCRAENETDDRADLVNIPKGKLKKGKKSEGVFIPAATLGCVLIDGWSQQDKTRKVWEEQER